MYMIYDANQKLLGVGDIYPAESTLQKGEHTIKLLLRHDDTSILEKLRVSRFASTPSSCFFGDALQAYSYHTAIVQLLSSGCCKFGFLGTTGGGF